MSRATVFISHTSEDGEWVNAFADGLERSGLQVFRQERDIAPGQVELRRIEEAIGTADTGLLVLSPAALADAAATDEYAALLREATGRGLQLVPVLYGTVDVRVPPLAGTRVWADFRGLDGAGYDAKVAALARVVQ